MRGIQTPIKKLRKKVFTEVAKVAFDSKNINDDIEAIPYKITPSEVPLYRESIYRERAICSERVRLAMGLSLRPDDEPVHVTSGLDASNVAEKYYEPPLMQVIPSACDMCEDNVYEVSDQCRGCMAHPCIEVCPKNAISMVNDGAEGEIAAISGPVSNVVNAKRSAPTMRSQKKYGPVPPPVGLKRSAVMSTDGRKLITRSVFPADSVW